MKTKWLVALMPIGLSLVCALLWMATASGQSTHASAPSAERDAGIGVGIPRSFPQTLSPSASINACGVITTTTTWSTGNDYVASNCSIVVNADVTLTIEAGVTVMFTGTSSALIVNGTLLAESANPSQPITFTSLAATKSPGQWFGLHFASGSRGRLRNAFIGYAGSGALNGSGAGWNLAQVHVVGADVQIRNSLVTAGKKNGIYFEGVGLSPLVDTVQVSNNASGDPANPAYAIYQLTVNMTPTFRSLVLTGNDTNAVTINWAYGNEYMQQNVTIGGSGAPYRFDCHYTSCVQEIPSGKTLTINPGTELQYEGHYNAFRLVVLSGGNLLAEGTVAQPITFTSGMTTPLAGDWQGIQVQANGSARLAYCDLGYAGGYYKNIPALEVASSDVHVSRCRIHDNGSDGIYLAGDGIQPVLDSLELSNNAGRAIYQRTINMSPAYSNLTFASNGTNAVVVYLGSALTQRVTWRGVPWYTFEGGSTNPVLQVAAGGGLTVTPGTELRFPGDSYRFLLLVQAGGTLVAEGTASQPITFTASITQPGSWRGIQVDANGSAHLAYVDLGYAGGSSKNIPALDTSASDVQVRHTRLHDNGSDGIRIHGTNVAPVFEDVSVLNSGGYGVLMGDDGGSSLVKPAWDGGTISGSGKTGIYMSHWASAFQPILRNLTIANNQGDGVFIDWNGPVPTFENVAITGNTGAAVTQNPDSSPVYLNLTLSGNGTDAVVIPGGTLNSGRAWGAGQPELPFRVQGSVNIPLNAFLSLEPGMNLRFYADTQLYVNGGALYALGTPDHPISFTGLVETPGFWLGIQIGNPGQSILQNCDIGYAGSTWNGKSLNIWSTGFNVVQNCRIHHSAHTGIYASVTTPILSYNQIYSNTDYGVIKDYDGNLDARYNWWGDPSGPYHATLNPNGKGDKINDARVLFDPWLTAPPTHTTSIGQFIVDAGGPRLVSPGQTVDYAIQYINMTTQTVADTVLVLQLPVAADYVDNTGGGIYWPERNQAFWKLGSVPPGANGLVSVRVRFRWGLPRSYNDGTITLLAGSNFRSNELNVGEYNVYPPRLLNGQVAVSPAEFEALRQTYADLQTLYTQAMADGYIYVDAARLTYSSGAVIIEAVLRRTDRRFTRLLVQQDNRSTAITVGSDLFAMHNTTGGMTMTLSTTQRQFWGDWAASAAQTNASTGSPSPLAPPCTEGYCKLNCIGKKLTFSTITGKVTAVVGGALWLGPFGGVIAAVYDIGSTVVDISECYKDCATDMYSNCCTGSMVRWSVSSYLGGPACVKETCNATTGNYGTPGTIPCALYGQRCVAGYDGNGGCKNCQENSSAQFLPISISPCAVGAGGVPRCKDLSLLVAKDPNALYGPIGDLMPGQQVTYTITYENEGQGNAYGVYVTNPLADVFDASTMTVYTTTAASSLFITSTRELVWLVGELGPQGTISSTGAVTYTVRLKTGLPSGTVVRNQATVYFPSVPEETPTNPVNNVIQPLVALPQQVSTDFRVPVIITLQGRDVSDRPLTYSIVASPTAGTLSGTPPVVTYTPADNFTGGDFLAFEVGNGITESRSADVLIQVNPSAADTQPPQVLWTEPVSGAVDVLAQTSPLYTDASGPAYAPFAFIGFTKVISASTVSTRTVQLIDGAGRIIPSSVSYDGMLYQVVVVPRQSLWSGTAYTVTVTREVKDVAGNALAADYAWSFRTAGSSQRHIYLPLIVRNTG